MIAKEQLQQYISRLERLEEDKAALLEDIRNVMSEAKGEGFDTKILRQVLKLKKMDRNDLSEQDHLIELYRDAIGV